MPMKKRLLIILGALVVAFLLFRIIMLVAKGSGGGGSNLQRPPVAVEVDRVRYGPIKEIRQFTGSIYPDYQYAVAPKVSGRILEIRKRIGDWVQEGEVIARIDDAEYQQAVLEAEASLKIAQASLAEAQSQFILAGQDLAPELMQHDCTPDRLAAAIQQWFDHPQRVIDLQDTYTSVSFL